MAEQKLGRRAFLRRAGRWGLVLGAAAGLVGAAYGVARGVLGWGRPPPPRWQLPLEPLFMAAHRGGAGLFPENTLAAFRGAREQFGCRFMELDVRASRDGVPVVIHDADVARTTDGAGPVAGFDLAELQGLDAGYRFRGADGISWAGRGLRIPTLAEVLAEVLAAWPESVVSIEIKQHDPPCEAAVVAVVRRAREAQSRDTSGRRSGTEFRTLLGSARHGTFLRIQALAPEIPSFFSFRSSVFFFLAAWLGLARWYRPPHNALMVPRRFLALELLTPAIVRAAHRLGLPVLVWTINQPTAMERLLAMGVDGIVTDRPDRMAEVLKG